MVHGMCSHYGGHTGTDSKRVGYDSIRDLCSSWLRVLSEKTNDALEIAGFVAFKVTDYYSYGGGRQRVSLLKNFSFMSERWHSELQEASEDSFPLVQILISRWTPRFRRTLPG